MTETGYLLGIDVGGTFTDIVLADVAGGGAVSLKMPTTPADPVQACMAGVERLLAKQGIAPHAVVRVVHATTLATNLLLSRTGVPVGYLATRGFGDIPRIGREVRTGLAVYDLMYEKPLLPVGRGLTFEVDERIDAHGEVVRPLTDDAIEEVCASIRAADPPALAICLMNSYASSSHESRLAAALRRALPGMHVAVSSEICPEYREYDRASTTIISAYVGPVLDAYLQRLGERLTTLGVPATPEIMQSSGGIVDAMGAVDRAVCCLESGPAAGVLAAAYIGSLYDARANVISFDMGGTTAKAGVVRAGLPTLTSEFHVGGDVSSGGREGGGFPIKLPAVDLAEVGAGGGSIAWVDDGGLLRVGPQSAGAVPGPACYGRGGEWPTTTDADLVLGYLRPGHVLDGGIELSHKLAEAAIRQYVAEPLGLDLIAAASGIHEIANAAMAAAIRVVTVERGIDPRGYLLCGFGGAGPIHIGRIATEFGISRIVVPRLAGVLSAVGLLASEVARDHLRMKLIDEHEAQEQRIGAIFAELESEARAAVPSGTDLTFERSIDVRFRHQAHELTVALPEEVNGAAIAAAFRASYAERFGLERGDPVQLVCFRLRALGRVPMIRYRQQQPAQEGDPPLPDVRNVYSPAEQASAPTAVYRRDLLGVHQPIVGPAIIEEQQTTVVVPRGFEARLDGFGNLVLTTSTPAGAPPDAAVLDTATAVSIPPLRELLPNVTAAD